MPKNAVDWAVSNTSAVEIQVGNDKEQMGWVSQIPDGWDCGYTYRYANDSVPLSARGVPMPDTFGGGGGGGKCTQVLHAQSRENDVFRITGRVPPQNTTEWVTWAQHNQHSTTVYGGGDGRAPLAYVNAAGKVQAVTVDSFGGSGKRGRNQAIDEMMSQRGGESGIRSFRTGVDNSWFGPSPHSSSHHDPAMSRMNPMVMLKSESGVTSLGGGKRGRNPHMESSLGTNVSFQRAGAPGGGLTGGGCKGRNNSVDARQSSNPGGLW